MQQLEQLEAEDLEIVLREKLKENPFYLIENGLLYIIDKNSKRVPLVLNASQQKVLDVIKEEWFAGRPVRIYILKARQQGFSTLAEAILYSLTLVYDNFSCAVIADKDKNSQHLFEISKYYNDNVMNSSELVFLHRQQEKSNAKEFKFKDNNSSMSIETAGSRRAGQSHTFQALHCSEISTWINAKETFISINQTLPNAPRTLQILETTANGVGNHAYNLWWDATENLGSPESSIIPIFVAWWEHAEYQMPIPQGVQFIMTKEEQDITKKYKDMYSVTLTSEQFYWRRWCIRNNCGGDVRQFNQEYPGCPEEAFLASGSPVFDVDTLSRAYEYEFKNKLNYKKYDIDEYMGKYRFIIGNSNGLEGDIDIYGMPVPNFRYLITADPAEGKEGGDYSVCNVFCIRSGEQVAHYSTQVDVDLFGMNVYRLAVLYNNAMIAPERNNHGHSLITILENQYNYGNIYKFHDESLGFPTTTVSRVDAINDLKRLLREGYLLFHNLKTIKELMTFVKDKGKMQAQEGCHDDEVTTLWVAAYVMTRGLLSDVSAAVDAKQTNSYKTFYHDIRKQRLKGNKKPNKTTGW